MKGFLLLFKLVMAALGALTLMSFFNHAQSLASSDLVSSMLLCTVCVAMILSSRGLRSSFSSPVALLPGIYLLSIGLPSLMYVFGFLRWELFFKTDFVSMVNYYVLGFLGLFYIGYLITDTTVVKNEMSRLRRTLQAPTKLSASVTGSVQQKTVVAMEGVYSGLVCILALGSLAGVAYLLGGEKIWRGEIHRGSGAWATWGVEHYLVQLAEGMLLLSTLAAGVIRAWNPRLRLWLAPISWAAYLATEGSRATLLPFLLFLLASDTAGRKLAWKKLVVAGALTFLAMTYITIFRPTTLGLVSFIGTIIDNAAWTDSIDPLVDVSSLGPTTATFWIGRDTSYHNVVGQVWRTLTPLPSFIIEQDIALTNVVPYVGIHGGNLGVPFPVIGELFFFFKWAGVLFGLAVGLALGWIFQQCKSPRSEGYRSALLWPLLYMACVFAGIMALHSGLRAVTRVPIWALLWYFCFTWLADLVKAFLPVTSKGPERNEMDAGRAKSARKSAGGEFTFEP